MSQVLPSGKTGANKYDLRTNDPNKVLPRLDVRQIAQNNQRAYQQTQGYSLSGNEGAASAIDGSLSIIDDTTIGNYDDSMAKMIQTYVANASRLIVDGGSTANSLILNPPVISPGNSPNGTDYSEATSLPFAYKEGLRFTFLATLSNTGAVQVQIPGLSGLVGSVDLVDENGNNLIQGDIVVNNYYTIIAKNISGDKFILLNPEIPHILNATKIVKSTTSVYGVGYLPDPITISNGTDTDHDIDFTAGNFQFDDGTGQAVATSLTKQLDNSWAVGNNTGGLDTGTVAADTFYYCFAIYNPTNQTSDFLFSTSASSPTMPSGYTKKKRIASLLTDGAGNIKNGSYTFFGGGYRFIYSTPVLTGTGLTPAYTTLSVSCPPFSLALIDGDIANNSTASYTKFQVGSKIEGDGIFSGIISSNAASRSSITPSFPIKVDSNSQIDSGFVDGIAAAYALYINGWIEYL